MRELQDGATIQIEPWRAEALASPERSIFMSDTSPCETSGPALSPKRPASRELVKMELILLLALSQEPAGDR